MVLQGVAHALHSHIYRSTTPLTHHITVVVTQQDCIAVQQRPVTGTSTLALVRMIHGARPECLGGERKRMQKLRTEERERGKYIS